MDVRWISNGIAPESVGDGVKVVDLARKGPGQQLEIATSAATEMLMSIITLHGKEDLGDYDMPRERLQRIRDSIPPELNAGLDQLVAGNEKVPAHLVGLALECSEPHDVGCFLQHLEGADPLEIMLIMLGYHLAEHHLTPRDVVKRAALGEGDARTEMIRGATKIYEPWGTAVERLLELGPDRTKTLLLEVLPRWHEVVSAPLEAEVMRVCERDAEAKRKLNSTMTADKLIEHATNGFQYVTEAQIDRVVLVPTLWLKPWILTSEFDTVKILIYGVADDSIERAEPVPPAQLVKLYKALGDEGRLRLIRRLGTGPMTLKQAAEEIGISKPTAHHHLALLRQAGLVSFREEGTDDNNKVYTLRRPVVPMIAEELDRYLGGGV